MLGRNDHAPGERDGSVPKALAHGFPGLLRGPALPLASEPPPSLTRLLHRLRSAVAPPHNTSMFSPLGCLRS